MLKLFPCSIEIEGKVSLDVAVHSGSEKRHTKRIECQNKLSSKI